MKIEARHLNKQFKIPVAQTGKFAGLRTLFSREFRTFEAVRDISFTVESGEFVGYIGPNGAGKSTTIKMLTGILHPSGGEVLLGGTSPHRERRKTAGRLGVVFGQRSQLWWDLPVIDSYEILAKMYRVEPETKRKRLQQFAELLELPEFWHTPVRKLSLGQRMRADLAAAMLHDPEVLFLDEPTIGLDVNAKRSIRQFLKLLNREFGKTILLTTHDMDDIEQLCGRVMVISGGEMTYDGTVSSLRDKIGLPTRFHVTYRGECAIPAAAWKQPTSRKEPTPQQELASQNEPAAQREPVAQQELAAQREPAAQQEPALQLAQTPRLFGPDHSEHDERLAGGGMRSDLSGFTDAAALSGSTNVGDLSGSTNAVAPPGSTNAVSLSALTDAAATVSQTGAATSCSPALKVAERRGNTIIVEANRQELRTMEVLRELSVWGEIEDIVMEEPDFEEVIHRVYQ